MHPGREPNIEPANADRIPSYTKSEDYIFSLSSRTIILHLDFVPKNRTRGQISSFIKNTHYVTMYDLDLPFFICANLPQ